MFVTKGQESFEDKIKSSFKAKAKMFLYTIALAKILGIAVHLLHSNENKA